MSPVASVADPIHAGMVEHDVLDATLALRGTSALLDGREERDHDLRAALFGIEASAEGLSRHRERLTPLQFDQLAAAIAAEVRRLRSLVDGHGTAPGTFDLVDAIDPVVASGRACGLDVRLSVPQRHRGHRPA